MNAHDHQRASRKTFNLPIQLDVGKIRHHAKTTNISQTGVAIISDKAVHLDVGTPCKVNWQQHNVPVTIDCHVVRVHANKIALAFQDSDGFTRLLEAV